MANPPDYQGLGDSLAFAVAVGVILIDCQIALRKLTSQLNSPGFWRFWLVAGLCGASAAACSHWASVQWLKDNVAKIKVGNPLRGLLIGLAVLTIIRSKLFNVGKGDNPVGGEFLYNAARLWAVQDAWNQWFNEKRTLNTQAKRLSFINDSTLEARVAATVRQRLTPSPDNLKSFNDQYANVTGSRPAGNPANDAGWDFYYDSFINVVLDYCGKASVAWF